MNHIATVALMLNLGVAGIYAEQKPVNMTFSGSNVATTINLQPDTVTDEELLAGNGTLGPFTYRELHADTNSPQPSSTCPLFFATPVGAGVFRFQDGSLLKASITGRGGICVDVAANLPRQAASAAADPGVSLRVLTRTGSNAVSNHGAPGREPEQLRHSRTCRHLL
jgi:hypothetical protein